MEKYLITDNVTGQEPYEEEQQNNPNGDVISVKVDQRDMRARSSSAGKWVLSFPTVTPQRKL